MHKLIIKQNHEDVTIPRPLLITEIMALPPKVRGLGHCEALLVPKAHPLCHLNQILGRGCLIIVRGHKIFWPCLRPDLSSDPPQLALLAHELMHVWQYKNGLTWLSYVIKERGHYHYAPCELAFSSMGYEQQAALIEDYVRLYYGLPTLYATQDTSLDQLASTIPPQFAA